MYIRENKENINILMYIRENKENINILMYIRENKENIYILIYIYIYIYKLIQISNCFIIEHT